jgi:hypothetical protein
MQPVPAALGVDPFYKKYVAAQGIPVISSERVPDAALLVARDIINGECFTGNVKVEPPEEFAAYDPTLNELISRVFNTHHIPMDVFDAKRIRPGASAKRVTRRDRARRAHIPTFFLTRISECCRALAEAALVMPSPLTTTRQGERSTEEPTRSTPATWIASHRND